MAQAYHRLIANEGFVGGEPLLVEQTSWILPAECIGLCIN